MVQEQVVGVADDARSAVARIRVDAAHLPIDADVAVLRDHVLTDHIAVVVESVYGLDDAIRRLALCGILRLGGLHGCPAGGHGIGIDGACARDEGRAFHAVFRYLLKPVPGVCIGRLVQGRVIRVLQNHFRRFVGGADDLHLFPVRIGDAGQGLAGIGIAYAGVVGRSDGGQIPRRVIREPELPARAVGDGGVPSDRLGDIPVVAVFVRRTDQPAAVIEPIRLAADREFFFSRDHRAIPRRLHPYTGCNTAYCRYSSRFLRFS